VEVGAYLGIKDSFNRKYLEDEYQINLPSNKKALTKRFIKELKLAVDKEPELFIDKTIFDNKQINAQMLLNALRKPPPHSKFKLHILPYIQS
jgi:hypothetical protein